MLQVGDRIERYEVEAFLGEGGLARVYRVRHQRLGATYALKMLSFRGARLANRLLREGQIQSRLKHPNVVTVLDVIEHDGRTGLLMEFVEGESLEQALNRAGAFPLDEALDLFAEVLSGVSAAHDAGVLHRDLKPGNILLQRTSSGTLPKVTDFGIARLLSTEAAAGDTLQTDVIGTPGYMAPEQASDPTAVDVRADLFSLGAVLYGMVTGYPAFAMGSLAQVLADVEMGRFTPVLERKPDCPETVAAAIERCLAPDPGDRFASCRALAAQLYGQGSAVLAGLERTSPVAMEPVQSGLPSPGDPGSASPTTDLQGVEFGVPGTTAVPLQTGDSAAGDPAGSAGGRPARGGIAALILGVGILFAGGWWLVQGDPAEVAAPASSAPASTAAPPASVDEAATPPPPDPVAAPPEPGPAVGPAPAPDGAPKDGAAAPPPGPEPEPGRAPSAPAAPEPDPAVAAAAAPTASEAPVTGGVAAAGAEPADAVPDAADDGALSPEPAGLEDPADAIAAATPAPEPPPPEAAPEPAPAPAAASAPPGPDLQGTWAGRLAGRPTTLRVLSVRGDQVRAELEVLMGTAYRTFPLAGVADGARLRLQGEAADGWALDVALVGSDLVGTATAPGRKKVNSWRGTRQ